MPFIIKKQGHYLLSQSESVVPPVDICICYMGENSFCPSSEVVQGEGMWYDQEHHFLIVKVFRMDLSKTSLLLVGPVECELPKICLISYPFHSLLLRNRSLIIATPRVLYRSSIWKKVTHISCRRSYILPQGHLHRCKV